MFQIGTRPLEAADSRSLKHPRIPFLAGNVLGSRTSLVSLQSCPETAPVLSLWDRDGQWSPAPGPAAAAQPRFPVTPFKINANVGEEKEPQINYKMLKFFNFYPLFSNEYVMSTTEQQTD